MIGAPSEFELVEFEQVEAAPGTALLRVTARPGREPDTEPPALLIADGSPEHRRLTPLPSPPGPPDVLRVAFSAPMDLVGRGTTFALELADGSVVRLPAPSHRRPARGQAGIAAEVERRRIADAERMRALEVERRRAVEAERQRAIEVERLRNERDQALADRNRSLVERNQAVADRDEAESRARAAAAGAGALEAQARSANETATRLQTELGAAEEYLDSLRRELVERSQQLDELKSEQEILRAEVDTAREDDDRARRRITELTSALEQSEERESVASTEIEQLRERISERDEQEVDNERLRVLEEALVVRDAEIELLGATVSDLVGQYEEHADAHERAEAHVELLEGERAQLAKEHERLTDEYSHLSDERAQLLEEHGRLLDDHGQLLDERAGLQSRADELFVRLEDSRIGSLASLDLLRDALLERLHGLDKI